MTIHEKISLLAATGCGIQIGAYLLLSLFQRPLLDKWPSDTSLIVYFKLFHRFCLIVALISGILAIFAGARQTGFLLSILGMSHLLVLTHLLPAMIKQSTQLTQKKTTHRRRSPAEILQLLSYLQITIHFTQLLLLLYLVESLMS